MPSTMSTTSRHLRNGTSGLPHHVWQLPLSACRRTGSCLTYTRASSNTPRTTLHSSKPLPLVSSHQRGVCCFAATRDFQAFSMSADARSTLDAISSTNDQIKAAKKIVIVGGGPTGVEFAGEVAEHRNGKPGWFSKVQPNVNVTLIT